MEDHPDQLAKGIDAQLDRAVKVLEEDVAAWKKSHQAIAGKPAGDKPAASSSPGTP